MPEVKNKHMFALIIINSVCFDKSRKFFFFLQCRGFGVTRALL